MPASRFLIDTNLLVHLWVAPVTKNQKAAVNFWHLE